MSRETTDERSARLRREVEQLPTRDLATHRRASRRSFLTGGVASLAAFAGWRWLVDQQDGPGVPPLVRRGYELGEGIWGGVVGGIGLDARTYALSDVTEDLRVNGRFGLRDEPYDPATWQMTVEDTRGEVLETFTVEDLRELRGDEVDLVVEHKCIEGWSTIVQWGGMRFGDLLSRYTDRVDDAWTHVALATPDGEYYVGLDRATMLHHQTLLAWELNGEDLTDLHGAPVRMATPIAYGIKQLKRIGRIAFATEPPPDFWAERGYPYFAGL